MMKEMLRRLVLKWLLGEDFAKLIEGYSFNPRPRTGGDRRVLSWRLWL